MTLSNKAGDTSGADSEAASAVALSQPRITGKGASRTFANPWPEWQVSKRSESGNLAVLLLTHTGFAAVSRT